MASWRGWRCWWCWLLVLGITVMGDNVAEVTDLNVNVMVFGGEATPGDAGDGVSEVLKLNISWMPPKVGRKPTFYSVLVTSVRPNAINSEKEASSSCPDGSIYHTVHESNITNVLLPAERFGIVEDAAPELDITPGCSYRVQVRAHPRNTSYADSPSVMVSVPECVGSRCNCEQAETMLPVPLVNATNFLNGSVLIRWKIKSPKISEIWNVSFIQSYRISVGVPHMTSSSGLTVYNKTLLHIAFSNESFYLWNQNSLKNGTKIFITAQDAYGCSGQVGFTTVEEKDLSPFCYKHFFTMIAIQIILLMFIISGLYSFIKCFGITITGWHHRYKLITLRKKSPKQISSALQNSKLEGLLKHPNLLYVQQDIVDAQRKDLADEYEIPYSRLRMLRQLGQGQFGKVYLANLLRADAMNRPEKEEEKDEAADLVAVKVSLTSLDGAHEQLELRQELLEEIAIMKAVGRHPHLVGLIGCCTLPENPVCLVLEYMSGVDLLGYLHQVRDTAEACSTANYSISSSASVKTLSTDLSSHPPTTPTRVFFGNNFKSEGVVGFGEIEGPIRHSEMLRFALEIAKGMEHLETKGFVHRDLAARNVLMDEHLTLKVSDFGLSRRNAYMLGTNGVRRLPIRWMPPEAIRRRVFTSRSDVWSYGLVLWEIATLGDFPYPRLRDEEVLHHLLEKDGRPEPAGNCVELREAMDMCWARKPELRPNFQQIVRWLESKGCGANKNNPAYQELALDDT